MEQQVLQLLQITIVPKSEGIRGAEQGLKNLYSSPEFPFALLTIASHAELGVALRQAALLQLKQYVPTTWSPQFEDDFKGTVFLNDAAKGQLRERVFALCVDSAADTHEQKVSVLSAAVASKIATVDFPDAWPTLLPQLLHILTASSTDAQAQGALRVLSELIDSGFTEEQFFAVAKDLVHGLQTVATNASRGSNVRAMAMNVFRSCFDVLEMVMEDHKVAVKAFLDESLKTWMPFFVETIKLDLPPAPSKEEELAKSPTANQWTGMIALKLQVVKTLEKIRAVFVQGLTPHAVVLFEAVWEELSRLRPTYVNHFIDHEHQSKLEDSDNLPYTLDFLVLEEIDFLQMAFKAPPVKAELDKQLKQAGNAPHTAGWLQELIKLVGSYAQIPSEEQGIWEFDFNLYLSEATAVTANYTPRTACAELVVRGLGEWLKVVPVEAVLFFCQQNLALPTTTWTQQECMLFILTQLLRDVDDVSSLVAAPVAAGLLHLIGQFVQDSNNYIRCAAHFALGSLFRVTGTEFESAAAASYGAAIQAVTSDESEVVQITCLKVLQDYIPAVPAAINQQMQGPMIAAIAEFLSSHDLRADYEDADDVKAIFIETLRDVIMINTIAALDTPAIDLLFTLASNGASNFQLFQLLTEAFENIVTSVASQGHEAYIKLCAKTIPSLTGAFDVANMTQESALTNLAAELVSALAAYGSSPLPDGFVGHVMPKLNRVLMEAVDAELVRPATYAVQHMLSKGATQYLAWTDASGKSAVEVTLTIINRLLNSPDVEESAATEVGGLASELVNKAGADKLGPYLMQLLQAVAIRLATAERPQFIQSLLMVFAGLTIEAPKEVADFLSEVNINGQNGLGVVMCKWLENSVNFAGFDEIRQNVVALSKLYGLQDPRIKSIAVKGDLVVENTGRIKTRSQARNNPDRYTSIPADLKIIKILVDELSSAASNHYVDANAAADLDDEEGEGDEWEDVGGGNSGVLDLGGGMTKSQLLAYANEEDSPTSSRARDDETAEYLVQWFKAEAQKPGFGEMYAALNDEERAKLQVVA